MWRTTAVRGESVSRRVGESATTRRAGVHGERLRHAHTTRTTRVHSNSGHSAARARASVGKCAIVAQPCTTASERAHVQLGRVYIGRDQSGSAQLVELRANVGYAGAQRVSQRDVAFTCDHSQQRAVEVLNDYLVDLVLAEPLDQQNGFRLFNCTAVLTRSSALAFISASNSLRRAEGDSR